eukprot:TRINITY_DN8618_c0_g1_i2.p1 TRINITY_DN8618_c0_g1~~TRINITY_DN8618_c0_g1_i2.p1  ORF type:complete len:340 (+),score=35.65 TRINITY_DN8618_c0_g1_i2:46-1065(+)
MPYRCVIRCTWLWEARAPHPLTGATTCGGYLALNVTTDASNEEFKRDMDNFASWGIDSLKVDGCNQDTKDMSVTYPRLSRELVKAGQKYERPIVYSCSWPAYIGIPGQNITAEVYDSLKQYCNIWRNWDDISDTWDSVKSIIRWWHDRQLDSSLLSAAGPGHFNDPDMILAGNTGLSKSEYEVQFAMWSIFAAPLLMSNDLRNIDQSMKELLQNSDVIAVNQDKLGIEGRWVSGSVPDGQSVWARPLENDCVAVALLNGHAGVPGTPSNITFTSNAVGLKTAGFQVYDLLKRKPLGTFSSTYTALVESNSVHFLRLSPATFVAEASSSPSALNQAELVV